MTSDQHQKSHVNSWIASSELPTELLSEFLSHGRPRKFARAKVILNEGDAADALWLILEGKVSVYTSDENGREIELSVLGPGEYFGELMIASKTRTASVRTISAVRVSVIQRTDFESALAARPDIGFHVIRTLVGRIRALTENVRSLALMDVYGRVSRLLLESATEIDGVQSAPYMSQQKIADRVGSSRSMVHRILKDLTAGGYLRIKSDRIILVRTLPKRW